MTAMYEKHGASKDALNDSEITLIHDLLTDNNGFFIDRELLILLTPPEVSQILGIPIDRNNIKSNGDDEPIILRDLIRREEVREWSNLPDKILKSKEGEREGISLLSVFEYMLRRAGGIVEGPGKFPSDGNQIALQKEVLTGILVQVPDWKTRIFDNEAA